MFAQTMIRICRLSLCLSLLGISYLAFTPVSHPVMEHLWDKSNHLFAFFVLAGLLDFSFPGTRFNGRKWLLLLAYGLLIEVVQYFIPNRYFSLLDVVADMAGVLVYVCTMPLLARMPWLSWRWVRY